MASPAGDYEKLCVIPVIARCLYFHDVHVNVELALLPCHKLRVNSQIALNSLNHSRISHRTQCRDQEVY